MPEDKIKQEIEDILNQLDTFLPEEKQPIPFRRPKRSPSRAAKSAVSGIIEPLTHFSLRQLMLTSLILLGVGFVASRVDSVSRYGTWLLIAGVVLFLACFVLSIMNRGGSAPRGPAYEKRWRGQPMNLDEPGIGDKFRGWFRPKKR
jgi:hypothetical protein